MMDNRSSADIVERLRLLNDGVSRPVSIMEREVCGRAADLIDSFSHPAQPAGEAIAFVPVHPRNGPLWSDTYASASFSERSPNYPRMALYAAQPPAAPVESATKSAPVIRAPQNTAERLPSSDAAGAGADTRCSAGTAEPFTPNDAWDELVNKDDRTSPEEYPEMCLISFEELMDYMERAVEATHGTTVPQTPLTPRDLEEVMDFFNSIEGAGYGGMASFEIARMHIKHALTVTRPQL